VKRQVYGKVLSHFGQKAPRRASGRYALTALFMSGLLAVSAGVAMPASYADDTPSQDDINQARAEADAAKMSVGQIEVELAAVSQRASDAMRNAQIAGEELNKARLDLDAATAAANKARDDADKAQAEFDKGRQELAAIAQTAYRSEGSSLDAAAAYLQADGLRSVEFKQTTLDSFANNADTKMQRVAALEKVASVMKESAESAEQRQQKATNEVQERTDAAQNAANSALASQQATEARRSELVAELARKENTTVELINQREAELERRRVEAARKAAEEESARLAALAARQEEEAATQGRQEETYTPPSRETRPTPTPTPTPAPTPDPAPAPSYGGSGGAQTAVNAAYSFLGVPYVWAGESYAGVDCSGLVMLAWRQAGVYLPHYSASQYGYGTRIPLSQRQPGDLLFWSSDGSQSGIYHVAIALGGDQMIEAPYPGTTVRVTSIYGWSGSLMPYVVRL